jgi:hypothetical protein
MIHRSLTKKMQEDILKIKTIRRQFSAIRRF